MRSQPPFVVFAAALACATACLCPCVVARADGPPATAPAVERPYPGVTYRQEVRKDPAQRLFWATVDLSEPKVSLHVSAGGPDPDGPGKWQTTLMTPTSIAKREGFELTVNGDFFDFKREPGEPKEAPGVLPTYKAGAWAVVIGPAATDGRAWNWRLEPAPCLVVKKSGAASIEPLARPRPDDAHVIAGNAMIVQDGKPVPNTNAARHPRTVVGLDAAAKRLTILVVDGRRPGLAEGMNYAELSREMIAAGCDRALNFDGGGSSVMVLRAGDRFEIKNSPSSFFERPVANVLGVDVKDAK